jgi:hypothetical protein
MLDRNYIPKTLEESFEVLKLWATKDQLEKILSLSEKEMIVYHRTVGRTIKNHWGFWTGDSDLFLWFKSLGIWHPDDMSGIILKSFYRHLKNLPLQLDEQVKYYKEFWEKNGKT